ncbi:Prenyltransferase and squalene oxidase repeat family protein [Cryptosporidium felis]|nr:Prenyltransferase and squalene oxidase repeat family protein [Cryptosporidium felis]
MKRLDIFNLELHKKYLKNTIFDTLNKYDKLPTQVNSVFVHGIFWVICSSELIGFKFINELPYSKNEINKLLNRCKRGIKIGHLNLKLYSLNPFFFICPTILSHLSGVQTKIMLNNELSEQERFRTNYFVKNLIIVQNDWISINNSIKCINQLDVRFIYSSLLSSYLANLADLSQLLAIIPISKLLLLLKNLQNRDGGFGRRPRDESHAGYTFCAVASIAIIKRIMGINFTNPKINYHRLSRWLLKRIIVSDIHCMASAEKSYCFNGRTGKKCDACYSWWVIASLKIIELINPGENMCTLPKLSFELKIKMLKGILLHQNIFSGGFQKIPFHFNGNDISDPLHTFLSISALSLLVDNISNQEDENSRELLKSIGISDSIIKIDPISVLPSKFLNLNHHH